MERVPPPAALYERVDLPRKRERCTDFAAPTNPNTIETLESRRHHLILPDKRPLLFQLVLQSADRNVTRDRIAR